METIIDPKTTKARKAHKCMYCCQEIEKHSKYLVSTHIMDGEIYRWKCHIYCSDIANALKMFDNVADGLTTESFIDYIKNEYNNIMSETQTELYESKEFIIPKFSERLLFVLNHHNIQQSI